MRDELATHLALMRRRGLIDDWHDRHIIPGQEWSKEIDAALDKAEVEPQCGRCSVRGFD